MGIIFSFCGLNVPGSNTSTIWLGGFGAVVLCGILDCAVYVGASLQAVYFGSILTESGDWTMVFNCIIAVLVVMIVAAVVAGRREKIVN